MCHKIPNRFLVLLLIGTLSFGAGFPKTREEAGDIVTRSKKDPDALQEFKGASLEVMMPPLREIWTMGDYVMDMWEAVRKSGEEKEFLEHQALAHRDPYYYAKALPIARELLMSHPDFEWTVLTKLGRMNYVLNAGRPDMGTAAIREWVEANGAYPRDLDFVALIPGDAAFRIIGPCLFSPYSPMYMDWDLPIESPASRARSKLEWLLKKRYGETLPKDIEEARAWWKANENRFAAKPAGSPATVGNGEVGNLPAKDPQSLPESQPTAESTASSDTTFAAMIRPWSAAIVAALLIVVGWFWVRRL